MKKITELLGKRILFFDGAMGTMLQGSGLKAGELPELLNITNPALITSIHKKYYDCGCNIATVNTFGANACKLKDSGYTPEEVITAAINCAKAAREQSENTDEKFIAMDMGPIGRLIEPMGDLGFDEAYGLFSEMASCGEKAGADLILIETMGATYEVKAAVLAAKENTSLPIFVTCAFDASGKTFTGADCEAVAALLEGLRVDAYGLNCGLGPDELYPVISRFSAISSLPLIFNPNAGLPKQKDGATYFDVDPQAFAASMQRAAELGLSVMGGCCGTTPAHMSEMIGLCRELPARQAADKGITFVSSYTHAVRIGEEPLIVGERINPTGKKRFKEALKNDEISYILGEGIAQVCICFAVLVGFFVAEVADGTEVLVGIIAVEDGVELIVELLDGSQLLLDGTGCFNAIHQSFDVRDVAHAVGHHHLFHLRPFEGFEALGVVLHHGCNGFLAMAAIGQFELAPHGHAALVPRLAGIADAQTKFAARYYAIYLINIATSGKGEADSLTLFGHIAIARIEVLSRSGLTIMRCAGIA